LFEKRGRRSAKYRCDTVSREYTTTNLVFLVLTQSSPNLAKDRLTPRDHIAGQRLDCSTQKQTDSARHIRGRDITRLAMRGRGKFGVNEVVKGWDFDQFSVGDGR